MTPVWHIAWKEYRALRGFWLAVAAIALVAQACVKVALTNPNQPDLLFAIVIWLPAFYALGCGATTFAAEKDDGTYEWLRTIPIDGLRILAGKLLYAVFSTLALFLAVGLLSRWIVGPQPDVSVYQRVALLWGIAALEALAWGMLVSLLTRKPLQSVVVAAAIGSTVTHLTVVLFVSRSWDIVAYESATLYRLAIVGMVLLADISIARNWLGAKPSERTPALGRQLWVRERAAQRAAANLPTRWTRLGRLSWQEWRASRYTLWSCLGVAVFANASSFFVAHNVNTFWNGLAVSTLICGLTSALLGASTFRDDHENQHFRFFTDHSITARNVWWARQVFWLVAAIGCGLAGVATMLLLGSTIGFKIGPNTPGTGIPDVLELGPANLFLLCVILPFATGQLASALLRSALLAVTGGLALCVTVAAWAGIAVGTSMAWWWSLVPLLIACFTASRLRVEHWLTDRNDGRAWAKVWAVLLVPTSAVLLLAMAFRVYEVPGAVNGVSLAGEPFDVAAFVAPLTDTQKRTAAMYRFSKLPEIDEVHELTHAEAAMGLTATQPQRHALLDKYADGVERILHTSRQGTGPLVDPNSTKADSANKAVNFADLYVFLMVESGRAEELQSHYAEALDYYEAGYRFARQLANHADYQQALQSLAIVQRMDEELLRWSEAAGQTRVLLDRAIEVRRNAGEFVTYFADAPKVAYLRYRSALERNEPLPDERYHSLAAMLPWERARQRRLLKLITHIFLNGMPNELDTPWQCLRSKPMNEASDGALATLTRGGPLEPLLAQSALPPNAVMPDMQAVIRKLEVRLDATP